MFELVREFVRPVFSGAGPAAGGLSLLRRACLVTLAALAAQFSLGMVLNLYVSVPSSDARADWLREVETAPAALTAHALVGLLLLGSAAVVMLRAIAVRDRALIAAAGTGLVALLGAFAAGEEFVRDGGNGASLIMAVLASVALLCFAAVQALASGAVQMTTR